LQTICSGWVRPGILVISASWEARINRREPLGCVKILSTHFITCQTDSYPSL
jgi:hypothetical protein